MYIIFQLHNATKKLIWIMCNIIFLVVSGLCREQVLGRKIVNIVNKYQS